MYSVLIHKATRAIHVVQNDMELQAAKDLSVSLYEASKSLSQHGTLASGVCTLVVPSCTVTAGFSNLDAREHQVYQCGGY